MPDRNLAETQHLRYRSIDVVRVHGGAGKSALGKLNPFSLFAASATLTDFHKGFILPAASRRENSACMITWDILHIPNLWVKIVSAQASVGYGD